MTCLPFQDTQYLWINVKLLDISQKKIMEHELYQKHKCFSFPSKFLLYLSEFVQTSGIFWFTELMGI